MIDIFTWTEQSRAKVRPWLILGKGPTFSFREQFDMREYITVALNHAVRELKVDIAHAADIDVVEDCADCLYDNCRWLLMPRYPHLHCRATELALEDYAKTLPVLHRLDKEGRLLWYNLRTGPRKDRLPVTIGTFSGSIVTNLLGSLGIQCVRSLGVDGGSSYSSTFSDLTEKTLFTNGHSNFNIQAREIAKTVKETGMDYQALVEPIRIFVGCDDSQMVATRVLEHSIRKHTKRPVEFFPMCNMPVSPPKHSKNRPGTGFSFNRFLIPKLAGYFGRGIYLDADMLVLDDIGKLWDLPFQGKKVLCSLQHKTPDGWKDGKNNNLGVDRHFTPGRQMSVMLLNCEQLDWDIDKIIRGLDKNHYTYKDLMAKFCILPQNEIGDTIPPEWNCLEWYEEERSQLVHFTVVPTQPWRYEHNPLNDLWENAFREAVRGGTVTLELVQESVERKLVKPSLLEIALDEASSIEPMEGVAESAPVDEAARLREMLWNAMIASYRAENELKRIRYSPAWLCEEALVRKPLHNTYKLFRRGFRKAYRTVRRAA